MDGSILHFLAIVVAGTFCSIGTSIGQAIAVSGFDEGVSRQPSASSKITKMLFYGMFLIEGSFILSFIFSFMIFFRPIDTVNFAVGLAELGAALAITISASFVGIAVGKVAQTACIMVSKIPDDENRIQFLLIILLTLIDTPVFFTFTIGLFVLNGLVADLPLNVGYKLFSAAIAVGLGSVGPSLAQMIFAPAALRAVFKDPSKAYELTNFVIITEALIETGALFSFMIAILLVFKKINPIMDVSMIGLVLIVAALVVSIGSISASMGIGRVGKKAVVAMADDFSMYGTLFKTSFLAQVFIETCGLFAFIVSLVLAGKILF